MADDTRPTKKKRKLKHPQSRLLEGLDKIRLTERITLGNYSGMSDMEVRKATGKKKGKKSKAKKLLEARTKQQDRKSREKQQVLKERAKAKESAIAVVDVAPQDASSFISALDMAQQDLRNFMLMELSPTQFGVVSALDQVLQELNILMEGGVGTNAVSPFMRLNSELALIAITTRMCKLYGLDRRTTRKVIDAKIEFMRPTDFKPTAPSLLDNRGRVATGSIKGKTVAK